jgi:hypothetical protein
MTWFSSGPMLLITSLTIKLNGNVTGSGLGKLSASFVKAAMSASIFFVFPFDSESLMILSDITACNYSGLLFTASDIALNASELIDIAYAIDLYTSVTSS